MQSPGGVSLSLGADDKEGEDAVDDKELTAQQEQDINAVLANRDWSQNDAEEVSDLWLELVTCISSTTWPNFSVLHSFG